MDTKRLFFGMDLDCPWPSDLPSGHTVDENQRHLTLAFLGQTDFGILEPHLAHIPVPLFKVGFVGKFDQCLFLPPRHPRVAAWHITWLEDDTPLNSYQKTLTEWLQAEGFSVDMRHDFNPHVTITRSPFNAQVWSQAFIPLPCMITSLHLYESLGASQYKRIWDFPLKLPFEEIEHTADIGYLVYGTSFGNLFQHAQVALAFSFPQIVNYLNIEPESMDTIEDVVISLNQIVAHADSQIGIPVKAVSFHGETKKVHELLQWEMIIDV